ncbi:single-stranded DNA-binding protein [Xylella fastidiosa]|uniref:Single-stranded DNA-binding protein n=1 Tax=Xylella fastidiosa TaxID=2371 RepID=A0ABC8AED9_XYLFS|nr:single-stranded DNA-binding protein [Xylella fastidiosa]OCA58136.1 single-stranded DNA-binding protein [Xylella fastidiosa subsp. pauca 11399]OJZ70648.1 single-stranded DNA-binding protein [Xylella fastidiosa 6c]ALR04286.1 single-stranded DNA-binding protein [Xylella fastidiosa]ALR06818.1 single-stranded DNA-binding protein [Xylella fastidiosa]
MRQRDPGYIEGTIRYDKFTGNDGQERYVTEIIADQMQMLGGRDEGSSGITPQRRPAKVRNNDKAYAYAGDDFHDDDPPF